MREAVRQRVTSGHFELISARSSPAWPQGEGPPRGDTGGWEGSGAVPSGVERVNFLGERKGFLKSLNLGGISDADGV